MASQLKAPGTFYYYRLRNNDNDNVSLQVEGYMSYKTYYIAILTENALCIQLIFLVETRYMQHV
jgi:hypothetical protein